MTTPIPIPPRDELVSLYHEPGQSMTKLGLRYNVSGKTVKKWLVRYDVELKGYQEVRKEANALIYKENKLDDKTLAFLSDHDWLYDQRIVQRKPYTSIADELGVCLSTITKWIKKHQIAEIRLTDSEEHVRVLLEDKAFLEAEYAKNKTHKMIADELGISKSTVSTYFLKHEINSDKKKSLPPEPLKLLNDYDWLYDQRIIQRKPYELIGNEIGVSEPIVKMWVVKHNIPEINLTKSEHSVKLLLENKEYLETEYAKNKTQKEIADEIGVNKSTISVFFKKHGITTRPSNWYQKKGGRSLEEISLHDWITSVYDGEVIHSDKSVLANCFQLDLYIPDRKLAIEYNGLYTHTYKPDGNSVATIKGPDYHLGKTLGCLEKGINLVHVFSDQWKKNRSAVENLLLTKLGLNDRVPARKCIITTPTVHEKNTFLEAYHLQGKDKSLYRYGLSYNGELVALMTFGTSRFNRNYDWELIRFCVKTGVTVVGGFSKLLAAFRREHSGSIVSYADRSHSTGNVYEQCGFTLINTNKPSFWFVNMNSETRYNRSYFNKKRLLDMLELSASDLSEKQLTNALGIPIIWNCGTLVYEYL